MAEQHSPAEPSEDVQPDRGGGAAPGGEPASGFTTGPGTTPQSRETVRSRRWGRHEMSLTPGRGQTEADIEAEFDRGKALVDWFVSGGTEEWRSHYRWWGPVKVMAYREVGPPPWRFPKVGVKREGANVRFIAGWRSTAYAVMFKWQRKPPHIGRNGERP